MIHRRRAAALGLSLLALGAFVSAPAARAQTAPADVTGSARGVGLELSLLGNGLTLGLTTASGDTSAKAVAEGAGQANPLVPGTATKAEASTGSEPAEVPQTCDAIVPPEVSGPIGLNLGLACSSASASVQGGMPSATSTASVAEASVNANTLLDTLGLGDPLDEATGQLIEQLQPIFGGLDGTPLEGVVTTVSDLLDDVLNTETLRLRAGTGSSSVIGTETGFVATGTGQGAVIDLLPTGAVDPANPTAPGRPVATIEVGDAVAKAVWDNAKNVATAEFDPAVARVTIDRTVALGLGLNDGSEDFVVEVAPGQTIEIPVPGVGTLARIIAGHGEVKTLEDGTMQAVADGVRVEVLPEVEGGLLLSLAHAEAAVKGAVPPAPPPAPEPAEQLPRTGSDAPVLVAAVLVAGALGLRRLTGARRA